VMVWFHGGGQRTGSGNSIFYDGRELARRHDVVVVHHDASAQRVRLLWLAGCRARARASRSAPTSDSRSGAGARMGARQHRALRRRRRQRHDLRAVRRRRQDGHAHRLPRRARGSSIAPSS
jgi:hypothetical protein